MRTAAIMLALAACYSPAVREGVPCGADGACPTSLVCDPAGDTCERGCSPGFVEQAGRCVDIDECASGAADCSADATCANTAGAFSCACKPGFAGDGRTCERVCNAILVYDDCTGPDEDCSTIVDPLLADNAAHAMGMEVRAGATGNQAAFAALYEAKDFDVIVIESSLSGLSQATANLVAQWIEGGGKAILSYWDLDGSTAGLTLRTAADVMTVGEITTPRDVHPDPASPVDLFELIESVPAPLVFTDPMVDDGDELALGASGGFLAARHTSATGPGAIAVTREGRVITLGFVPVGLVFQGPRDADADGTPDAQELYTNLLGYLCGY